MKKDYSLTSKGQVTIPAEMRKQLELNVGDSVEFILEGNTILLKKKQDDPREAFGLIKSDISVSLAEMEAAIRREAKR